MCGRFTLFSDESLLQERFQIDITVLKPNYNIAPSQDVLTVVSQGNKRNAEFMRWGLIPFWAKDKTIGNKMINARAESLDKKPSYKRLLSRRRCLIVADGFYEWQIRNNNEKHPYRKRPVAILPG